MLQPKKWWEHFWIPKKILIEVMLGLRMCVLLCSKETPGLNSYSNGVFLSFLVLHCQVRHPWWARNCHVLVASLRPGSPQLLDMSSKWMSLCWQKQRRGTRLSSSWWMAIAFSKLHFSQTKITTKIESPWIDLKLVLCFDWAREDGRDDGEHSWELLSARFIIFPPFL